MQTRREFIKTAGASMLFALGCSRDTTNPRRKESKTTVDDPLNDHRSTARVDPMQNESKILVDVPLFDALWKLDPQIEEFGIAGLGIMFAKPDELENGSYWCTPTNSLAFAWTGGDGVHFSFIVRNSRVDSNSPILLTAPANGGNANLILAPDFRTFLRLGLRRGYFALEQLTYNPTEALQVYGSPDWEPSEQLHYDVGYVPDAQQKKVIAFVAESLKLEPFSFAPEEFAALQDRFMPLLELPEGYEGM